MSNSIDHREVRKVQFTGRSTYVLSLPKKWIHEMHIKAGDPVTLIRENDNSLSLIPDNAARAESTTEVTAIISPAEAKSTLRRKVVSMYLAGYNIIHLKVKTGRINAELRDGVREVVRRNLVGTEMIADASDNITLQVLLSLPELSINTATRRMYLIASSMHRDAISSLAEQNRELASEVVKSDDEVDRFSLYILRNLVIGIKNGRALREMGLRDPSDCLSYRVAVKSIERTADHACGIAERATKLTEKLSRDSMQKIDKMSQHSLAVLNDAVEALLRRNYQLADKTVDAVEAIHSLERETLVAIEKEKFHDSGTVKLILEDIRRTAEYASDIAEAAINQTIEDVIERHPAEKK